MRSQHFLLIALTLLFRLRPVLAVPHLLVGRQDVTPSSERSQAPVTTRIDSPQATSSISPQQSSSAKTQPGPSSTSTANPSVRVITSTVSQAQVTTPSNRPLSTSSKHAVSTNPLPIQPTITPAIGIFGAVALISGIAYTLIGIRNKWLYIFFSAAYLSFLAITVCRLPDRLLRTVSSG
ncbi:hypothetical protein K504DRAFT_20081 [Pleomassaria siparia CBS 279.74]|uniref:Uncharacterized protein n=1 Tax=Pleomassaria siparia CBS 279.74 TaxID=1314801 RepID=A0A6G1KQL9_9PLEO|nr:hypothetical protein K504DRAFT_20081 [Pleomassaria siparia CBS 279.74]